MRRLRILAWHVHGSWMTAFVHGRHEYVVPLVPGRSSDGRGRARTYAWPDNAREVRYDRLRDEDVDVVVLQRPHEIELATDWLGRRPGADIPAVYVEHDTPRGETTGTPHPVSHRSDVRLVHVTHFNSLFWDNGKAPVSVVEHGVVDPGYRFTGVWPRAGVVINDPLRRWRITGSDLLADLSRAAPLDVYGMNVTDLPRRLNVDPARMWVFEDLPQQRMHAELARRRVYVHPIRWTSLGLSLIEAMCLGMPVVALATTEVVEAVPPGTGVVSTRTGRLAEAVAAYVHEPDRARADGLRAREAALDRYGLTRFHRDWDRVLTEVTR